MVEQKHLRMPSEQKMHRGRLTIEALQKEIYLFGYMFIAREPFKRYPNWRTDNRDYNQMLRAARKIMDMGVHAEVEASGFGGEAGSQFMVLGHITQRGVDPFELIDKAVAKIAAREQETKGVSSEEMHRIIEEAERSGEDLHQIWRERVIPRLPRDVDQIRSSLLSKLTSHSGVD
ncbi:MAG: hypothetical protein ACD_38C00003G0004 [uncultured bacterium]|uniref:Uncharacterized protein n=1 Tax=Candidatus Daviesbacteria bacterium GW2011_GWC2_40_12 TaxID=1618431 RepID=A0A0G0QX93_9BACT|nr:MAG: hypothetical protein ACD_38C00003G0004 [uncultured bacterium]KKR16977.1 MAG: hypothetical protein UT45_C0003G0007 [Candidatus Daviesbacteria bacterium GW2011_GWA2_39_33]KKR25422.1 MAG: hypothetical protein UT54_C0002G0005 [Candidatus Daviesbacteria bacterium GW2011_GWB1_39_5]KKR42041.1 MAG: hypothetical protein UT77_C0004G0025 [Candidatus Daviesbacteria bacterium GW2011_GWC2_40_12]OGE20809.1 MAG: hypothetical protein A2778_06075 [Candidatus Daviesbacteria bacterium RIFCSPHIGHO2_01_FULL_